MQDAGVTAFRAAQDAAVKQGRAHETLPGRRLLRQEVLNFSNHLAAYMDGKHPGGRRRSALTKVIQGIAPDKLALIALRGVLTVLWEPSTLQRVGFSIGMAVQDEAKFTRFQTEHKEYYDAVLARLSASGSESERHRHRVLNHGAKMKEVDFEPWPNAEVIKIGNLLVGLLLEVSDIAETRRIAGKRERSEVFLVPTQECVDMVMNDLQNAELAFPFRWPCIIPPAEWISAFDGGYYSPAMRSRTQLVKMGDAMPNTAQKRARDFMRHADMPEVLSAVNAMQNTAWAVNAPVLEVMREVWQRNLGLAMPRSQPHEVPPCPIPAGVQAKHLEYADPLRAAFMDWKATARAVHNLEADRRAHAHSVSTAILLAGKMQTFPRFWYVYQLDSRGRAYSTCTRLGPQGDDNSKALLRFADGARLGERGVFWLKVHGANKFGNDKISYEDRVAWVDDNRERWLAAASDPIGHSSVWCAADKPWQFLAWCFEYAGVVEHGPDFVSHLPVALDGSCNGLQHFSAMLRDSVGGAAVNLVPAEKPADIYSDVAAVCTKKLKELRSQNLPDHAGAANWLDLFTSLGSDGMPRSLSKPPVMTLPYGSTQRGCDRTTLAWVQEKAPNFFPENTSFRHSSYLTPLLWSSIGEVVIAARAAMDWLRASAGKIAKAGEPILWRTPLGFPVFQIKFVQKEYRIETQVRGRLTLQVREDTAKLDGVRMKNAASPNFVHALDATHMFMCLNAGVQAGIKSFAMIHDDFGVPSNRIDEWHRIIRECFVALYAQTDVLSDFKQQVEKESGVELSEPPPFGNLCLEDVIQSRYFFG